MQCFIIGPRHASAAGRKLVPVGLASPILYLPSCCHHGGGIRFPLMMVLCFPPFGVLNRGVPSERANAVVAVVRVVVVQRAGGIDVADVVRVGRYKAHPKKNAGRYRRGAFPLCISANRSRSFFLQLAVMRFTSIAYCAHAVHCSFEIRLRLSANSIRKRTSLQRERAFFCS